MNDRWNITFNTKKEWDKSLITQMKTRMGYVKVSNLEATMLDLVENQRTFGLGRIAGIIDELTESGSRATLRSTTAYYPTAILQRLGYILEVILGKEELTKGLASILTKRSTYHFQQRSAVP